MPKRTEVLKAHPTAVGARGEAIGRDAARRRVFITGALPGERAQVQVLGERPTYVRARAVEILEPSPFRTAPACPEVARGCGGCQWQHVTVAGQQALKVAAVAEVLQRLGGVDSPPIGPTVALPTTAYRTSLRAAVAGGRAGYRRARQHSVVPVDSCAVAHPLIEDLLLNGRYGEATEVVLRCGAATGERLAAPDPPGTSIAVPRDVRQDRYHEVVAGRRWQISARSFFQSRLDGAEALAGLVASGAGTGAPGSAAADLYSGVGLFAGVLAGAGWSVTAVEASADAVADADANLRDDDVRVILGDVAGWRASRADLVVADPSRRGLERAGVAAVAATGAARAILISCDAEALGRDTGLLRRAGYALTSVTPVDLFPHTFHVEVVSVFNR